MVGYVRYPFKLTNKINNMATGRDFVASSVCLQSKVLYYVYLVLMLEICL